jgi:hypothetical protein
MNDSTGTVDENGFRYTLGVLKNEQLLTIIDPKNNTAVTKWKIKRIDSSQII